MTFQYGNTLSIYMPPIRLFKKQRLSVFHNYTYPKQMKLPQTPYGLQVSRSQYPHLEVVNLVDLELEA